VFAAFARLEGRYCPEQREADEAQAARDAALGTEQDAKASAKKEIKEARMAEISAKKSAKSVSMKKERLAAGLSAESMLRAGKKSECCVVM
jgi:hypothetical protein